MFLTGNPEMHARADAFGKLNDFLFLSQVGMRSSMLASIREPFALSSSSGMNCSHLI